MPAQRLVSLLAIRWSCALNDRAATVCKKRDRRGPARNQLQPQTMAPSQSLVLEKRRRHCGPNLALNYSSTPLHIVRGQGAYLYDAEGREYLDCVNNVSHVGHCHPKVTMALCQQLSTLNTNCRYLHESLSNYSEALAATLPNPLEVVYMTTSGSEANDLALRLAQAASPHAGGGRPLHLAVIQGAYHGHLQSTLDASPYKFWGPGGAGQPAHVHVLPAPDTYRGMHLDGRAAARRAIQEARQAGGVLYAFICESLMSCAGQVVFPPGYLAGVYDEFRAAGVLCIADEVQVGFGRMGSAFWAFELAGVVPDIVTLGKPAGNGFPMAAAVTSADVASAFDNGMEYFSTFGGCTAAGTVGLAVLHAIKEEGMQAAAAETATSLEQRLRKVQQANADVLGDVRGMGLMWGLEWVTDPISKTHSPALAAWVKARCLEAGVLLSTDGMLENVNKIKPPMVWGRAEADRLVAALEGTMSQLTPTLRQQLAGESRRIVARRRAEWERMGAVITTTASPSAPSAVCGGSDGDMEFSLPSSPTAAAPTAAAAAAGMGIPTIGLSRL